MNQNEEKMAYAEALESGLLSGKACYRGIDAAIREMEEDAAERKFPLRGLLRLAIPVAALLVAGTAVAAGILLTGKGSRIPFFSQADPPIQAQQGYYERHSDAVEDIALDAQGEPILTIENIAIHRERVAVFYRTEKEQDNVSLTLSLNQGEEREPSKTEQANGNDGQSHMATFVVFPEVPTKCTLSIRSYEEGALLSEMTYEVDLSQGKADEVLILSGKTVQIEGTHSVEPTSPYPSYYDHTVTVKSVRIDRDGGCVTLSEPIPPQGPYTDEAYAAWDLRRAEAKEAYFAQHPGTTDLEWSQEGLPAFLQGDPCPLTEEEIRAFQTAYDGENEVSFDPFINFAVTDENGVSLMPQLEGYTGGSGQGLAVNEIRFTPREGMKAIRLTPLYTTGEMETVRAMFDPAENGDTQGNGKLELVAFDIDKQTRTVTVTYRTLGIRMLDAYGEFLLDRQGEPLYVDAMYEETHFADAASGAMTTKITLLDADQDMDEIGGYGQLWSVPYLAEDKAVTIWLEP